MPDANLEFKIASLRSVQPWFVLGANHFDSLLTPQSAMTSHFYSFDASGDMDSTIAIPDGCIDLLFDCSPDSPNAYICGSPLEAIKADFTQGHNYLGVRFRPGVIPDLRNLDVDEVISNRLDLSDLVGGIEHILEQVGESDGFISKARIINDFISQFDSRSCSYLTMDVIALVTQAHGNLQIKDLVKKTGYSARTLQRAFRNDTGLTPKAFSRAIRCQSAVYNINHNHNVPLSDLAFDLGFSDQAHFQREFKKLVSVTPLDYQSRTRSKAST
ncbi:helix-turn-helix domain-containing protein [Vibrio vulnificus]|uniref:helix-turn-helix domain-containing protein n=2 Tax=Vibrio vulnificus TaxID=672 RepID=UPI0028A56675|nr:AraC family transcriptional regulator [Vibrio vulnificus]HDY8060236.1 AraC family transcriptional regulator [Vibrio vulnificus]HDY8079518.1 AraC family transcriptional regulator [Vibrio vulnificus]HDY8190307.1 AraC family transcriptional regulator [Vibrio vulnificus]